jgi:hypothetical protein
LFEDSVLAAVYRYIMKGTFVAVEDVDVLAGEGYLFFLDED